MTTMEMTYMAGMVASVWVVVLACGRPYAPMWPMPPFPAPWAQLAVGYFEMVAMFIGCVGYFTLITLFGCTVASLTGLFRALSFCLEEARGWQQVLHIVQLHQHLNQVARQVEHFFADVIAHIMVAILIVPLVATLQVVFNVVDPLTFMSSSILVSVFLPMSSLSEDLTQASLTFRESAYYSAFNEKPDRRMSGPLSNKEASSLFMKQVLSESVPPVPPRPVDVKTRQALLLVMVSTERPARVSLKGLGPVSLATAMKALRVWYQWGNMLVSVSSG